MSFLKSLILGVTLAASVAKADIPAIHGMALFGESATYVSHLPMFHSPHDYQVVMKVHLANYNEWSNVLAIYHRLKATGQVNFTIAPEVMDLTKVMNGEITQFKADLYQGHFEKGGQKLGKIIVKVEKSIVAKKLIPTGPEQKQYLLFGESGEYYAVHLIDSKPSYDQILKVAKPYALEEGFCRTRACSATKITPISDGQLPLTVPFFGAGIPATGSALGAFGGVATDVLKVIHLEEHELSH